MNIHRELAIYRVMVIRAYEAMQRLRDAQAEAQERGDEPGEGWEVNTEAQIHVALDGLARKKADEIADAYEDRAGSK